MRDSWVKGGDEAAGNGRERHLDRPEYTARRKLLAAYRQRASEALRQRKISRGAYVLLDLLIEWARTDGNGDSTTISERTIHARTSWDRKTIRTYRRALEKANLVRFDLHWVDKSGWFYNFTTTLFFVAPSGGISPPVRGGISPPVRGGISPPSLNRGTSKRLSATREALPGAIAPEGQSSGLEGAIAPHDSVSGGESTPADGRDGSPGTAFKAGSQSRSRRYRRTMQIVRETLGEESAGDVGKWGERAKLDPDKVERVLADFIERLKAGMPVLKTVGAALEDTWNRFSSRRRNGHAVPPPEPVRPSETDGRADVPPEEPAPPRGAAESERQRRMWAELKAELE